MTESALGVIDMQRFFFEENRDVDAQELTGNCQEAIDTARDSGIPIINVVTKYSPRDDRADWPNTYRRPDTWCSNLVAGNELAETVDGLTFAADDLVVEKKRFDAFYDTQLDDLLRNMGCKMLYLTGYSADVCVRMTAIGAYNRGYDVGLIEEAIESFKEPKEAALHYLKWLINAERVRLDDFRKSTSTGS